MDFCFFALSLSTFSLYTLIILSQFSLGKPKSINSLSNIESATSYLTELLIIKSKLASIEFISSLSFYTKKKHYHMSILVLILLNPEFSSNG